MAHAHWNRGIATESARRVIRYAFMDLEFQSIEASTDIGNTASLRVLEKLGMAVDRRDVVDGLDTVFYTLSRSAWRSSLHARPVQ